jgi:hypothetical protein
MQDLWFGAFRIYGTLPNLGPNMFGLMLVIPATIFVSRAVGTAGRARWGWVMAGLLTVVLINATLSRGAQLGLFASLFALAVLRRSVKGVAVAATGSALMLVLMVETTSGRHLTELVQAGQLDPSATERLGIWRAILREAPHHPVGLGFNGWLRQSRLVVDVGLVGPLNTIGSSYPAENQWLRELADRGIPGVVFLTSMILGLGWMAYTHADRRLSSGWRRDILVGVGAGFLGFAVAMLTGDMLMFDSVAGMFWYAAGLLVCAARSDQVSTQQNVSSSSRRSLEHLLA